MLTLEQMEGMAREAGEILVRYFGRVQGKQKKDHSLVSVADQEAEALILGEVGRLAPALPVLAEESRPTREARAEEKGKEEWLLAVDPLDGTAAFLAGLPIWGVSLGLLHWGRPWLGVLYFPHLGEMYRAGPEGAFCGEERLSSAPFEDPLAKEASLCMPSGVHRRYHLDFAGKLRILGSTAYHLAMVAKGAVAASVISWVWLWDLAGGLALCQQTGRDVLHLDGSPFDLAALQDGSRLPSPLLVADPHAQQLLRPRITYHNPTS